MKIEKYRSHTELSPMDNLFLWAYENPEKALEIGAKLVVVGGLLWFLGALFTK